MIIHVYWCVYKVGTGGVKYPILTGITPIANGSQLHIDHVTRGIEGEYICEGTNGVETIDYGAYLYTYGNCFCRFCSFLAGCAVLSLNIIY